jgi:hypothetical protein
MPQTASPRPRVLRPRFAALGVVGVLACSLPLMQVLRVQSAELRVLLAHQEALDPIAHTVSLQWGLVAHRDLAAQVLDGVAALEAERQTREREVDASTLRLHRALQTRGEPLAADEAQALIDDWQQLVRDLVLQRISAPRSNEAHRLLIEQTLQIIDYVSTAAGPLPAALVPLHALLHQQLPRLALAGPAPHTEAAESGEAAVTAEAADGRQAAAGAPGAWQEAQGTVQAAQAAWAAQLAHRQRTLERLRAATGGAGGLAMLLIVLALLRLRRGVRHPWAPSHWVDAPMQPIGNPSREEAQRLLQRLRAADASTAQGKANGAPPLHARDTPREGPPTGNATLPPN